MKWLEYCVRTTGRDYFRYGPSRTRQNIFGVLGVFTQTRSSLGHEAYMMCECGSRSYMHSWTSLQSPRMRERGREPPRYLQVRALPSLWTSAENTPGPLPLSTGHARPRWKDSTGRPAQDCKRYDCVWMHRLLERYMEGGTRDRAREANQDPWIVLLLAKSTVHQALLCTC